VIENLKEDSIKIDRKEILYYDCLTLIFLIALSKVIEWFGHIVIL